MERYYVCIDLKSFYASVECVERGLDPMTTNLVVADPERSDKTICLAVSPAMKALGIKNRCRVFEIPKNVDYIMAVPRMQKYIDYSAMIYGIYLRYISKDDIHVYSIDEAFIDVTPYLKKYRMTAIELGLMLMDEVYKECGIRATCGVGTNLYLAKIALDITAKHSKDFIGYLDEEKYRKELWDHRPLNDFWRIGRRSEKALADLGIFTMRQIAEISERDPDFLYKRFGVDAELLIDHAYGREPVTIRDIKNYKPKGRSISNGQVLMRDYEKDEGRVVLREMVDRICLELVEKGLLTNSVTVSIRFSNNSGLTPVRGTASLKSKSNAEHIIAPLVMDVYERIMPDGYLIRGFILSANTFTSDQLRQMTLTDIDTDTSEKTKKDIAVQKSLIGIKKKFGKNAVFKAMDLQEGATARERNEQIGGHKSGKKE